MSSTASSVASPDRYTMTVDLSVLESLGINLYSNAAAVLSELVANAYDADANTVSISWREDDADDQIVVVDDGCGMTVEQINTRFLTAGYKKRVKEGTQSVGFKRPFMGRKGIGKLSVFSIATIVTVYTTTTDGTSNGLTIDVNDLQKAIAKGDEYHPPLADVPDEHQSKGTVLVLESLKKRRANLTANALRKRLARRFDVLDERTPEQGGFKMKVNGKPITYADREELKKLEFIWEFGQEHLPAKALPNTITRFVLDDNTVAGNPSWKVGGWIGTSRYPDDLKDDEEAGSLKNVIVIARKRPIQEGIIEKLDFSRVFGSYVTGQIEADFLDLDNGYEDIATSDRQRLIEDDPRVMGLVAFLRSAFLKAAETWTEERPKREAKDALKNFPRLKDWVDGLPADQHGTARKMIGTIASLPMEKKRETQDRATLMRAGVLAFARIGLQNVSDALDRLSSTSPEDLLRLLGAQDAYETALWGDILRSRIDAIQQFRGMTDANDRERVLQQHLFDRLWLIDPAWERATEDRVMEQDLKRVAPGVLAVNEDQEEITGRFDIRYRTVSGRHVIVELKRYLRTLDVSELAEQGTKYFDALTSILSQQQLPTDNIDVVFVLGSQPKTPQRGRLTPADAISDRFNAFNGRFVLYDELIGNALRQYQDYLNASAMVTSMDELLDSLTADAESPAAAAKGICSADESSGVADAAGSPGTAGGR